MLLTWVSWLSLTAISLSSAFRVVLSEEVSVCDSHEEEALGSISLKVDYLSKVFGLICAGYVPIASNVLFILI